jgi:DNA-directed RNA polymerase specialized sigma24 family protein
MTQACPSPTRVPSYSQVEFRQLLSRLSDADMIRLAKIARHLAGADAIMSPDDLLAEALARTLDGSRKCPRDLAIITFLARVMESMAWAERNSARMRRETVILAGAMAPDGIAAATDPEADTIEEEFRRRQIDALLELFRSDAEATVWLRARMAADSLEEVRQLTGFDAKQIHTIGRRIRRRVERAFPQGLRR